MSLLQEHIHWSCSHLSLLCQLVSTLTLISQNLLLYINCFLNTFNIFIILINLLFIIICISGLFLVFVDHNAEPQDECNFKTNTPLDASILPCWRKTCVINSLNNKNGYSRLILFFSLLNRYCFFST